MMLTVQLYKSLNELMQTALGILISIAYSGHDKIIIMYLCENINLVLGMEGSSWRLHAEGQCTMTRSIGMHLASPLLGSPPTTMTCSLYITLTVTEKH